MTMDNESVIELDGLGVRFGRLVGASPVMCKLYEQIERAGRTWDPVLILGESGMGRSWSPARFTSAGPFRTSPSSRRTARR